MPGPNARGFVSQWNIGYNVWSYKWLLSDQNYHVVECTINDNFKKVFRIKNNVIYFTNYSYCVNK